MTQERDVKDERMFTVELRSKSDVKNVHLDGNDKVFIEGSLGSLKSVQFVEDLVLEVIGSNGELRVDLSSNDLRLRPNNAEREEENGVSDR